MPTHRCLAACMTCPLRASDAALRYPAGAASQLHAGRSLCVDGNRLLPGRPSVHFPLGCTHDATEACVCTFLNPRPCMSCAAGATAPAAACTVAFCFGHRVA